MPYERRLADSVRAALSGVPEVSEQPMFGGLSFLIAGNLAVALRSAGGLLVRVGSEHAAGLLTGGVTQARMGQRLMKGWLDVPPDALRSDSDLARWVRRGVDFAASLPPKRPIP